MSHYNSQNEYKYYIIKPSNYRAFLRNMEIDKNKITKDYYTTQELVDEPWFPVRSTLTVKKLIEQGKLRAIDISTSPRFKRYRIEKQSVIEFLEQQ